MIKSISLNNFQSHRDTKLEFVPGVNVIVGDSANGKTGFLRGLKSCLYKTPFYVSWWGKEGYSEIEMSDVTVRREYSASSLRKCPDCKESISETDQICPACKSYISDKTNTDKYIFDGTEKIEKFGTRLPEPYLLRLKMYPVFFVDYEDNLNLKNQHDDFFFIGNSYGGNVRNKILSSLIPDSSKVDVVVKTMNTRLSSEKSKYEFYQDTVEKTKKVLESTEIEFLAYQDVKSECIELVSQIEKFEKEIVELKAIQAKLKAIEPKLKLSDKVAKISPALDKLKEMALKGIDIEHRVSDVGFLSERITKVSRIANIETQEFSPADISESKIIEASIQRITVLGKTMKRITQETTNQNARIKAIESELKSKKASIKDSLCPIINDSFCDKCKEILCKESK